MFISMFKCSSKVFTPFLNKAQNKSPQYVRMHVLLITPLCSSKRRAEKMCHNCAFTFNLNKRKYLIDKIYLNFMCGRHRLLLHSQNVHVNSVYLLQCRHCRRRWFFHFQLHSTCVSLTAPWSRSILNVSVHTNAISLFFIKIKMLPSHSVTRYN